ncbi:MAG: globin [Spongiibacteraceae bacterium]
MPTHAELIVNCLELVTEKSDDIAPGVYQRFFARYPEAEELFGIDPADLVKGNMIISLLQEIMWLSEGVMYSDNIKRWISDHKSYGVTLPMYPDMFTCLLETIEEVIGDDWTEPMDKAWKAQYDILINYIEFIYKPDGGKEPELPLIATNPRVQ